MWVQLPIMLIHVSYYGQHKCVLYAVLGFYKEAGAFLAVDVYRASRLIMLLVGYRVKLLRL